MFDTPSNKMAVLPRRSILYCRVPGLLAQAARAQYDSSAPIVVCADRFVRDVCPAAHGRGVRPGKPVTGSRYLCPTALFLPLEQVQPARLSTRLLELLSPFSSVIEPAQPDTAYAVLPFDIVEDVREALTCWAVPDLGFAPVVGVGVSRTTAFACAESGLPPERFREAGIAYLWQEDIEVVKRLSRLGFRNFGEVAAAPASLFREHFGRVGRLIHARARGKDYTPVRPLFPAPRAEVTYNLASTPIANSEILHAYLQRMAERAAAQLCHYQRYSRHLMFCLTTENETVHRERFLNPPIQSAQDIRRSLTAITNTLAITAPVQHLRLVLGSTEIPAARSLNLFPTKAELCADELTAMRETLAARFGTNALVRLSEIPRSLREVRREKVREALAFR